MGIDGGASSVSREDLGDGSSGVQPVLTVRAIRARTELLSSVHMVLVNRLGTD